MIDFWQCKWSRHPENKNFVDGDQYFTDGSIHFDFTFVECDQASRGFLSFLIPEYEIVRTIAIAEQKVDITASGEIRVDGTLIADRRSEEKAEFRYSIPTAVAKKYPNIRTEPTDSSDWTTFVAEGQRYIYDFRRTALPQEPKDAGYLWECRNCSDQKYNEDGYTVPEGYFLAMFDYAARPRIMLIRTQDLLGHPFVVAKQRW